GRRIDSMRSRRHSENIVAIWSRGRTVMANLDFESLARELRASDIYVGLQTAAHGMMVWVADRHARLRKGMVIGFEREAGAGERGIRTRQPVNGSIPWL